MTMTQADHLRRNQRGEDGPNSSEHGPEPASWQKVWRGGFGPSLPILGLRALRDALADDDRVIVQGATTQPPPLLCISDWKIECADGIGYAMWKGLNLETVGEVADAFGDACGRADDLMGEPAACRWFLNWFDDTPREEMRRLLVAEIEATLHVRGVGCPPREFKPEPKPDPITVPF